MESCQSRETISSNSWSLTVSVPITLTSLGETMCMSNFMMTMLLNWRNLQLKYANLSKQMKTSVVLQFLEMPETLPKKVFLDCHLVYIHTLENRELENYYLCFHKNSVPALRLCCPEIKDFRIQTRMISNSFQIDSESQTTNCQSCFFHEVGIILSCIGFVKNEGSNVQRTILNRVTAV